MLLHRRSPRDFDNHRTRLRSPPPPANGMTAPMPDLIRGSRNGGIVDKAGEFIASLSSHSNCFPIFTSMYAGPSGELNSAGQQLLEDDYRGITKDDLSGSGFTLTDKWEVNVDLSVTGSKHNLVRKEIVKNIGHALVFLIGIKTPHAIIVIRTPDGKNYSCGFGYLGHISPGETPKLSKIHSVASKVLSEKISHTVEPLRGAIYTADYLTPDRTREAKIIWVGILTQSIVDKLNETLATGRNLRLDGAYGDISTTFRCKDCETRTVAPYKSPVCMSCKGKNMERKSGKNIISILEMKLSVNSIYLEASAFVKGAYYNCIEWAKFILDIPHLNCGFKGNPNNCLNVTEDEIGDIMTEYEKGDIGLLSVIIQRIQDRLSKKGLMTKIRNCLGCSGGKRRKINKKYTKRSRLHSRRRRSIKKKIK